MYIIHTVRLQWIRGNLLFVIML